MMIDIRATEVGFVQNKALGAYLIHRTILSYEKHEKTNTACPLHLLFLTLPVLFQKDVLNILTSTKIASGIRKFTSKFSAPREKQSDIILRVHSYAELYKPLTWASITLGMDSKMLALIPEEASAISLRPIIPAKYERPAVKPMLRGADRLGAWFSRNSIYEVASNLKVRF